MRFRQRAALVAALAAATLAAGLAPGPLGAPLRRLANAHADGPDPLWNVPVDAAALRRTHLLVGAGETYFLAVPPASQLAHDLQGAAFVYLLPALPVQRRADANWIIGVTPSPGATRIAPDLYLSKP